MGWWCGNCCGSLPWGEPTQLWPRIGEVCMNCGYVWKGIMMKVEVRECTTGELLGVVECSAELSNYWGSIKIKLQGVEFTGEWLKWYSRKIPILIGTRSDYEDYVSRSSGQQSTPSKSDGHPVGLL